MKVKKEKALVISAQLIIFTLMLYFFSAWCPLSLYDADDWKYIGYSRIPLPIWGGWNPARVLPETLMPLAGKISAVLIYPIIGDYVMAVTITSAFICALLITIMCGMVYLLFHYRLKESTIQAVALEGLFLICCFMIFRNRGGSCYLFNASSLCCTYFYTIPGILNGIVILYMMRYKDFEKSFCTFGIGRKVIYFTLVYFSIFSNLFHSGMLALYAGINIILEVIGVCRNVEEKFDIVRLVKKRIISITIVSMWLIAVAFELSGGRAAAVGSGQEISVVIAIRQLVALILAMNKMYMILLILAVGYLIFVGYTFLKQRKRTNEEIVAVILLLNVVFLTIYELALNAKIKYMSRIEASWGVWFYCILVVVFVISRLKKEKWLPVVMGIMLIIALYPDAKFMPSNINQVSYNVCINTDNQAVVPILNAQVQKRESITIEIPDYRGTPQAWGFGDDYGQLVADALLKNGIIDKHITVTTIQNIRLNDIGE